MPCQLYRHYDAQDRLLYVGISLSAVARLTQHKSVAHWSSDIVRLTIETFPTRELALEAERAAIEAEKPLHNVAHNADRARWEVPPFPPELSRSYFMEDGEPHLVGVLVDAEGDEVQVDFSWVEGAPDFIRIGGLQSLAVDDATLEWLVNTREVAHEWAFKWRKTKHWRDYLKKIA